MSSRPEVVSMDSHVVTWSSFNNVMAKYIYLKYRRIMPTFIHASSPLGMHTCWQLDLTTTTMKKNLLRTDRRLEQQSGGASHTRAPSVAAAAASATHEYITDTSTRPLVVSRGPPTPDDNRQHARLGRRHHTTTVAPRACFKTTVWIRRAHVCSRRGRSSLVGVSCPRARCPSASRSVGQSVSQSVRWCVSASVRPRRSVAVRTISPLYRLDTCAGARAIAIPEVFEITVIYCYYYYYYC